MPRVQNGKLPLTLFLAPSPNQSAHDAAVFEYPIVLIKYRRLSFHGDIVLTLLRRELDPNRKGINEDVNMANDIYGSGFISLYSCYQ